MSVRSWITEIVRSVIREEIKETPMIISARAPTEHDTYAKGTQWLHGRDKYLCIKISATWVKGEDEQ